MALVRESFRVKGLDTLVAEDETFSVPPWNWGRSVPLARLAVVLMLVPLLTAMMGPIVLTATCLASQ
jgi:hypothetical protein